MNDCVFCKIIKGELPSKTLYEDETTKVIILDIDEKFISNSFKLIKETLYPMLKEKLNCEGLTLLENNFLGQEIKHFHIHLIPRYKDDHAEPLANKDLLKELDEVYNELTK